MASPVGLTEDGCPFCAYLTGRSLPGLVEPGLLAFRGDRAHAFPSLHQRAGNRGHHLVVPSAHTADVYRLAEGDGDGLMSAVATVARAVRAAFEATGITIMQHNEWDGGQDVFHLHVHVVPRHAGDGFHHGDGRWPHGLEVVSLEERRRQAEAVAAHLGAAAPAHPAEIHRSS